MDTEKKGGEVKNNCSRQGIDKDNQRTRKEVLQFIKLRIGYDQYNKADIINRLKVGKANPKRPNKSRLQRPKAVGQAINR